MYKRSRFAQKWMIGLLLWLPIAITANAKDLSDLRRAAEKYLPPPMQAPAPTPAPVVAPVTSAPSRAAPQKATDSKCQAVANAPLSNSEIIKTVLVRAAIDEAAKRVLKVEDLQIPQRIGDVCIAAKRLAYIERSTGRWSVSVIGAIEQAKEALDLAGEASSYAAFKNDPDFSGTGHQDLSRIQKDLKNDLELIQAAITEKRAANKEKLSEASASLRAALTQGGIIAGWDKVLLEFIGDNARWAFVENSKSVLALTDQVGLLSSTAVAMQDVMKAHSASSPERANDKKVAAIIKQREQENAAYEKELVAELQL